MSENEKSGNSFLKGMLVGTLLCVITAGAVFGIYKLSLNIRAGINNRDRDNQEISSATYKKIGNIEKVIDTYFYRYSDEVGNEHLEDGIYRGMVESLNDPYAVYYSKEDLEEEMNSYEGVSYGIGCTVTIDDDGNPMILGIYEGSPAESADVKEGDIIVMVEGEPVAGYSLSKVVSLIKGPENTSVEITFARGEELIEKTIVRGKLIENDSVDYGVLIDNDQIGYVRIYEFSETTVGQFSEALDDLRGENIKGLVIDLRNNPGGAFDAVVDIARMILPEGIIVYTEDNIGNRDDFSCDGKNELDIPLTVLVNEYSASASEILTGAIKDHNKGVIIGKKTFGKGIVQRIINLGDGSAIKLTVSAYFTPSGQNIQGTGIEPDIEVELDTKKYEEGEDTQLSKAIEVLEQRMK